MPPRTKNPPAPAGEPRKPRARSPKKLRVDVTAVLVAHDGAAWLPETLAALAKSTRTPAHVVCVDTGSTDGSAELMAKRYDDVLHLPRDTGYGAAVATALASLPEAAPQSPWIWLLHDDVAVEPTTLRALLEHADQSPSAGLLGPKVRDWNDPRVLVEVGLTTDAAGHRETGLERREYDQGQHDSVRDVLAVGTAAALVRRHVWDQVGGLDPHLPVFRDDLDLGWKINAAGHRVVVVPEARVRHARAATTGHRNTDAAPGRATGIDRKHALYVLFAHASFLRLLGLLPRLLLATAFRSLGLLLTRQVAAAGDEWRALAGVLGRPGRLHKARRSRASFRTVPTQQLHPLFASRFVRIRARVGAVGEWLAGGGAPISNPLGALGDPGPDGPGDAFADPAMGGGGTLRRLLLHPGVLLFLALSAVAGLAERSLIFQGGPLKGGALLPAPAGARDLWRSYLGAWHDVTVGTGTASPPGTAALAALSSVLFGQPSLALDVLLLASVPLAGLTAYLAAGRLVRDVHLRVWSAATWALLPIATGSVAAGRLDTAAVQITLPLLILSASVVVTADPRVDGWWRAWALGLGLGIASAFAPQLWLLTAALLLATAAVDLLLLSGGSRRTLAAVLVAVVPAGILFPWSLQALQHPTLFFAGPQVADVDVPAWHLALLSPGGPGLPMVFITVGVVLGGLAGTVREKFRRVALTCWVVALVSLAGAVLLSHARVDGLPVWTGLPVQVAGAAVITAALVAASGARPRLSRSSFGWRQLLSALVAVAAVAGPLVAAGSWVVRGADDPLRRNDQALLPAFAQAELQASPGLRVLVLAPRAGGGLAYELTDAEGTRLDELGLRVAARQRRALDTVVADLASSRGGDAAEALSTRAVRYVALRSGPGDSDLMSVLDAQNGLVRRTSGSVVLWQLVAPAARLSVLPRPTASRAVAGDRAPTLDLLPTARPIPLKAGREGARVRVPAGASGRLLVLADASDPRWVATLDGQRLDRRTAWGWAQAFALPPAGGTLELHYDQSVRQVALGVEGALLLVVAVLAAPGGRRRRGLEDDVDEVDEVDALDASKDRRGPVVAR